MLTPVERPFSLLLPSDDIEKKQSFNIAFSIDCQPLANNYIKKDIYLSFAFCQCLHLVKVNRLWQQELLDQKLVNIVNAILLATANFWDPKFVLSTRHMLNLTKKLALKTKKVKNNLVKEWLR